VLLSAVLLNAVLLNAVLLNAAGNRNIAYLCGVLEIHQVSMRYIPGLHLLIANKVKVEVVPGGLDDGVIGAAQHQLLQLQRTCNVLNSLYQAPVHVCVHVCIFEHSSVYHISVGLAQTVHGISVYVYIRRINRIYTYIPYI